jgi:hypothetical protein
VSTPAEGPQTGTRPAAPASAQTSDLSTQLTDLMTMLTQQNERIAQLQQELATVRDSQAAAPEAEAAAPAAAAPQAAAAQSPSRGGRWGRVARKAVIPAAVAGVYSQTESGQENLSTLSGWASDRWAQAWGAGADLVKSINENVVQPGLRMGGEAINAVNENVVQPGLRMGGEAIAAVNDHVVRPAIHGGAAAIDAVGHAAGSVAAFATDHAAMAAASPGHTALNVAAGAAVMAAATPQGRAAFRAVATAVRHPAETMKRVFNAIRSNPESAAAAAPAREVQQTASELTATANETAVPNTAAASQQLAEPGLNTPNQDPARDPATAGAGTKAPEQVTQTPTGNGEVQQTGAVVSTNPTKEQGNAK